MFLKIIKGDVLESLKTLPDESVNTIITSPPYWSMRNYNIEGQIGLEPTLEEYLGKLLKVTAELKRVLRKDGVMFWNHGDCYGGSGAGTWKNPPKEINSKEVYHLPYASNPRKRSNNASVKPKCLAMQNYRLAMRMIDEQGWILRDIIIWAKKVWIAKDNISMGNAMPSSVRDRCTFTYEPVFMFSKSKKYYWDQDSIRVPYTQPINRWGGEKLKSNGKSNWDNGTGQSTYRDRNMRPSMLGANKPNVWQINTQPSKFMHFAVMPERLVEPMIKAGCPKQICKKCGNPRERIIKEIRGGKSPSLGASKENGSVRKGGDVYHPIVDKYTVGWTDCGCNAGWQEGVVLDPFMGSGTTLLVAKRLGCSAIGIELNPEYIDIAKKRLNWGIGIDVEFQED